LSYISSKHAGNSGTNRTTQAETSNLLRLSFPGRVITRELQRQLAEFFGSTSPAPEIIRLQIGIESFRELLIFS
jgi:hypothetical protein